MSGKDHSKPVLGYPTKGFYPRCDGLRTVQKNPYTKLCELLVSERQKANITQADLSSCLKRPQSFVSKYERGERRLDVVEFGYVASAIGFDPVQFLAGFYRELA